MKIAVISDIHDNLWNLQKALHRMSDASTLICCGDLCSPFVIDELSKFKRDVHIVFGNNDADLFRIGSKAAKTGNVRVHGELFTETFDGKRWAVNHFDYIGRPLAKSREFDVVCFGHNHELEIGAYGSCQFINPGPIMGAKFSSGKWEDVQASFAVYDTETGSAAPVFL